MKIDLVHTKFQLGTHHLQLCDWRKQLKNEASLCFAIK